VYAAIYYVEDYPTNKVLNALQNAKDRGVDVRLTLSTNSLVLYPSVENGLIARGIPYNWSTSHAKVAVIDGKIAYVGSANWNNNGLERNWELSIKTNDSDTIQEALQYVTTLWATGASPLNNNEFYYERFANGPEFYNILTQHIQNAHRIKTLMFVMTYNFTDPQAPDSKLLDELKNAYNRGANLQIVLDDPWYYNHYGGQQFLTQNKIPHKLDDKNVGLLERMHAKVVLIDDNILFIGSNNWHRDSLDTPGEASLIIRNPQTIQQFLTIFNAKWAIAIDPK